MENPGLIILSKQGALMRQMSVVANNIANMNTNGFKGEKIMFVEYIVKSKSSDQIGREKISFVRDIASARDLSEGPMQSTGNPLDIAIRGDGYLVVGSKDGDMYTRNGRLRLDETGQLVTQAGDPVLSSGGQPFFFAPEDSGITITREGSISTNNGELGKLKIVKFKNEQDLRQVGGGLFTTHRATGRRRATGSYPENARTVQCPADYRNDPDDRGPARLRGGGIVHQPGRQAATVHDQGRGRAYLIESRYQE